jgi:uncharacterized protein
MLHPLIARATGKSRAFRPYINVIAQLGQMTANTLFSAATSLDQRQGLPPVESWHPAHCGDSDMCIARDGTWFHQGSPIGRKELVRLFSTLLRKDEDGFVLVTPAEKLSIQVDDVPFIAVGMTVEGEGPAQKLSFTTNLGDESVAGPDHPLRFVMQEGAPVPYLHVRGKLEARLARAVYYRLIDLAVHEDGALGVWSGGTFFAFDAP